ncbi:asparagine synthetase domain-containing protein 1-like isoform X2 [Mya arenaria]|uniref:asparagine synthetase domain-containing protein 1-like isoform X2 n=1 Tax=Mya arenaria TaxID=6604 RepID=UPI0022E49AB0|nr:asparagine synthetase domain-containing protein 1-like isoform X2 [Mya arenaria]
MCGICCIFYNNKGFSNDSNELIIEQGRLSNRGPDSSNTVHTCVSNNVSALFSGHVLHLRGKQIVEQPTRDEAGNLLLWNGEIFGGIQVPEEISDTTVLMNKLGECNSDAQILNTLSRISGPWSVIYWQECKHTLWFGRDVFGRRSLLWHLPTQNNSMFALSSVQLNKEDVYTEVPSIGIWKMTPSTADDGCYGFTLFPWQHIVWPGTLVRVKDNPNFQEKVSQGQSVDSDLVHFIIEGETEVSSQMPSLNKALPPRDYSLPDYTTEVTPIQYLQHLLEGSELLQTLSRQLADVLLKAVSTRVFNQHHRPTDSASYIPNVPQQSASNYPECNSEPHGRNMTSCAKVAILFSGGIDSTVIAALVDKCLPSEESIDLINVAFEQKPKQPAQPKKGKPTPVSDSDRWSVPDRLTGYTALSELNPSRAWNFIEVNVTEEELKEARQAHIQGLVYPLQTVLDDSIGCAVWFAARGKGVHGVGPHKGNPVHSTARVILCGMGADEQLVGYSRHRNKFKEGGWAGLIEEIELEVTRISARNLGRDDRIITDHGKESRFPFLDERVVTFLSSLPIHHKADLALPRGIGEKLLLRLCATELGLHQTATLAKRAIQFGSRIAKLENNREKASDICNRLTSLHT